MEEVFLAILGRDEAKAAIGDDLLDGTGGHVDPPTLPEQNSTRAVRSRRGDPHAASPLLSGDPQIMRLSGGKSQRSALNPGGWLPATRASRPRIPGGAATGDPRSWRSARPRWSLPTSLVPP